MIERGDFVKLVTGGRLMTADRILAPALQARTQIPLVQVSWNTPSGQIGCATYPAHQLKSVRRLAPRPLRTRAAGLGDGV